jgi:4-amino-4-deoxy-L-arabinose transferase-like glycosyltransferase
MAVAVALVAWAAFAWTFLRPAEIASDWNGWRQTDTQTMALNLANPGSSVLRPQISWGGDGPGYVETEFQLYTKVASLLMPVLGKRPAAGQLVSLLAIVATGLVIFIHWARDYRPWAAALGVIAFLAARTSPHLATVVMPDALALLCYAAAWMFFLAYLRSGDAAPLIAFAVLGAVGMLTKPTTAHIGISAFALVLFSHRSRLRDWRLWAAWGAMVLVLALYLAHAHQLQVQYGNTFGLLSGEDSKTPRLRHLLMPRVYVSAARNAAGWGLGQVAALVLIVQALRRRLDAQHWALLIGNAAVTLLALRYMSQDSGNYYFAPLGVLAAGVVASFADDLYGASPALGNRVALAALAGILCIQGARSLNLRYAYGHFNDPTVASVVATGKEIDRLTNPGDLIVARSPNDAYDVFWQQAANYHDPRIFYLSGTHGWTLGREQDNVALLVDAARRGARFYADPLTDPSPVVDSWLARSADLVWSGASGGRIWKLHGA